MPIPIIDSSVHDYGCRHQLVDCVLALRMASNAATCGAPTTSVAALTFAVSGRGTPTTVLRAALLAIRPELHLYRLSIAAGA
jgi:hypothetical protein